jgi:hypothetical protein
LVEEGPLQAAVKIAFAAMVFAVAAVPAEHQSLASHVANGVFPSLAGRIQRVVVNGRTIVRRLWIAHHRTGVAPGN